MADNIFIIQKNGQLIEMNDEEYDSEALLQRLLAEYPKLLAGAQIDSASPRRWLLIKREMGIPGEESGGERWSVDHLFLDQDAIPTLVEVKRSRDTRIRREVVGQMLDYAANAVVYWPVEEIRATFESRCEAEGTEPEEELADLLGAEHDDTRFWQQVKINLKAGRIRMVFVADEIPAELRRVVEFLNEQMDSAEVLAIEIKQYVGEGMRTLVPRVIGQKEGPGPSPPRRRETITKQEFLSSFDADHSPEEQKVVRRLINWATEKGLQEDFRRGQRGAVFMPGLKQGENWCYPFSVHHAGMVAVLMRQLKDRPPFDDAALRDELGQKIQGISGLQTTDAGMEGFPKFPISALTDDAVMKMATDALDWIIRQIRRSSLVGDN